MSEKKAVRQHLADIKELEMALRQTLEAVQNDDPLMEARERVKQAHKHFKQSAKKLPMHFGG